MTAVSPPRTFLPLPLDGTPAGRPLRVCIVSPEFVGPSHNGGIGTAYTAMADALAAAGHEVTCLYSKGDECASHDLAHWQNQYRRRRLKLVALPRAPLGVDSAPYSTKSYEVYLWLKRNDHFDFVHFPEWQALGFHSQVAKRQGLAFAGTKFCVGLHSMTRWIKEANREYFSAQMELQLDFMERQTVALADALVSPSRYLLQWIEARGWTLPAVAHVQQNIMPDSARPAKAPARERQSITEIVFFGRLETRKGVVLFCDALDRLVAAHASRPLALTFLGKDSTVERIPGEDYVRQRAQRWPWRVQFLKDRNQPQAMEYLNGAGRLAVIPSLMENSPYTVLECLGAGIAFLASGVGGIPELIAPGEAAEVCFETRPALLAERLDAALRHGFHAARGAVDAEENKQAWVTWHETQAAATLNPIRSVMPASWPKVSLCITTFNRPALLGQALESVRAITYPNLEVVLVDDGSSQPEAIAYLDQLAPDFAARGWKMVRQPNRYLGAARNTGARNATGEFLLFMDDDNYAEPHEVTTLVQAMLASGSDIVCCGMTYFSGQNAPDRKQAKGGWLPLGGAASAGAFANVFGDANALVRRSCFEGVGGFTEDYGVTHEDWEFHAKAVLRGYKLQVVPEFLFWYRVNGDSMIRTLAAYPNHMRSIRPYLDAVPDALKDLVLFAHGSTLQNAELGGSPAWVSYAKLTVQWRSKVEAGRELAALGHPQDAARLMLAGIKAIENCRQPRVLLEALLGTCELLGPLDAGRTRYLLNLAIGLADNLRRPKEREHAQALLAALARGTPVAGAAAA